MARLDSSDKGEKIEFAETSLKQNAIRRTSCLMRSACAFTASSLLLV